MKDYFVHETATLDEGATIGKELKYGISPTL